MYHSVMLLFSHVALHAQLRMAVAEALGFMVHLLSPTALNDQLPKLLPGIMQLYRKHSEHYYISQVGYWPCINELILPSGGSRILPMGVLKVRATNLRRSELCVSLAGA